MNELNLGEMQESLLVFGGPYSNLQATQAMRTEAERLGLTAEQVICSGDVVAYCADAQATVDLIRNWGVNVVQGNCEESLGANAEDCGCGFEEGSTCSVLSVAWYRHANAALDDTARQWMHALPAHIRFSLNGSRFLCVHGSPLSINEFVFASTLEDYKNQLLAECDADVVIGGHCGMPFASALQAGWWLNAGVIGMPANDGKASTWYMLLEPQNEGVKVSWHRLEYNVVGAQQAMLEAGLPPDYREALATGLWPSMDVLPEAERAGRGRKLSCESVYIPTQTS